MRICFRIHSNKGVSFYRVKSLTFFFREMYFLHLQPYKILVNLLIVTVIKMCRVYVCKSQFVQTWRLKRCDQGPLKSDHNRQRKTNIWFVSMIPFFFFGQMLWTWVPLSYLFLTVLSTIGETDERSGKIGNKHNTSCYVQKRK